MSHWKRWNRRKRIFVVLAAVVLVTTAWVASSGAATSSSRAADLDAPIPPPQDVFIQQRDNVDGFGNAYLLIQLSTAQVNAKRAEGTSEFLTLGTSTDMAILRDDGQQGDVAAGDGLYTGIATVDHAALQRRATLDQQELNDHPGQLIPLFRGRAAVGVVRPAAFDYDAFAAGKVVRLGPAVAFLGPESQDPSASEATPVSALHSSGLRSMTASITSANPVVPGTNTFQNRVLMITNTSVIADSTRTWNPCSNTGAPNGVWTFNHLMTQMANQPATGILPADFVENWLQNWLNPNLVINSDPVPDRTRMNHILNQWPRVGGKLDLTKSPLRLLAIAPRVDLRKTTGGGGPYSPSSGNFLDGGELRFIFGFVAKQTSSFNPATAFTGAVPINNSTCYALPFTVIFEYRVPKAGCLPVKTWAQQWADLNNFLPGNTGTPSYNSKLQALTQQVVVANANPTRPNGSALGQLRTNEVALADVANGDPWELREFRLTQSPFSFLSPNTVEDTIQNDPLNDFNRDNNGSGLLSSWISTVIKPLLALNNEAGIPLVPLLFQSLPFLAGDARVPEPNTGPGTGPNYITFHWTDPNNLDLDPNNANNDNWARHRVSRASCNGCHRRETFTHFVHVNPADTILLSTWDDNAGDWTYPAGGPVAIVRSNPTLPAELSSFLTGINQLGDPGNADANFLDVRSPNAGDPKRNFDDLARRELDITGVANLSCSGMSPVNVAHVKNHVLSTGRLPANLFQGMTPQPVSKQVQVGIDDIKRNPIFEVH